MYQQIGEVETALAHLHNNGFIHRNLHRVGSYYLFSLNLNLKV
jgi:hypothetical protein